MGSGNNLRVLPGSFSSLRLDTVPSLLEMVATVLVKQAVRLSPEDVTPQLLAYMDSGMRCLCSQPVWNNVVTALVKMDICRVATEVSAGGISTVNIEASLCSMYCLEKFKNNPYAI